MTRYIAVIGPSDCSSAEREAAFKIGAILAARGSVVVCGGGSGVMEAAAEGAHSENGVVFGILPGNDHSAGNSYLTYAIATGLGEARNAIIARTADAVIAVGGEYGTLSEIALAMKMGKKVILLNSWHLKPPRPVSKMPLIAQSADEAVEFAIGDALDV
jgi:uncharacterized protein (TIGR00725 family)